jgi:hypothetical protein
MASPTTAELLNKEIQEITARTGYYIAPYRLANLMKTANKVMELITKAELCMTYHESLMVLRIVSGAIQQVAGDTAE